MSIRFCSERQQFYLHTAHTSYIIELLDGRIPLHAYWGSRLEELPPIADWGDQTTFCFGTYDTGVADVAYASSAMLPLEFPVYGTGDMRETALLIRNADGTRTTRLEYTGHTVIPGKPRLEGLPATYGEQGEAETLVLSLRDALTGLEAELSYSVFEQEDAIARSVRLINGGTRTLTLHKIASACVDLCDGSNLELLHLQGLWARERHVQRQPLITGIQKIDSKRGASSHAHNPFMALVDKHTTETAGDAYGFSFVYSGSFEMGVERDPLGSVRALVGINSFDFGWQLEAGEAFQAPEAVLVYSDRGLGEMSRRFHRLYRRHLCRGRYRDAERPVLVNNWEATYFHFTEEKLLAIAEKARELGIDMLVLDDGWFGKRNADNCSLGDWVCNTEKLPSGLKGLGEKLNAMGMQFGLWFEPEMISPDSDLYRQHPDWCIHAPGRSRSESRNQLVLDLSREDVCDYIIEAVSAVLRSAPVAYVKWDYNRNFGEMGSALLPAHRQMEQAHRYMLGLYRVLETITARFPEVLFESCSGGGGRFDPGMLYYMPQTWCSDDTDAVERLYIQYGTSMVYPPVTMGSHVSACPNHQVGRTTPFKMRGDVAMSGQFGYELDLSALSDGELALAKEQVAFYKAYRSVVQQGDMYRLLSPFESDLVAWEFEKDGTALLCTFVQKGTPATTMQRVKMQGLEPDAVYVRQDTGAAFSGAFLMQVGVPCDHSKDYLSQILVFKKQ